VELGCVGKGVLWGVRRCTVAVLANGGCVGSVEWVGECGDLLCPRQTRSVWW
jgi:hypothetical protein